MVPKVKDVPERFNSALRWIALCFIVIAFTSLCFWILAPWQLGKNSRTQIYNKTVQSGLSTPAMPLDQVNYGIPDAAHIWRLITISGHFLTTPRTTERLQLVNEQPALKSLTAFRTDNGKNLIIYRGYQPVDQPNFAPPPQGHLTLTARMHVNEELIPGKETAIQTPYGLQVYSINSHILTKIWKIPLESGYFALVKDSPGVLSAEPLPELKTGPYLSYGIQWIAFGVLAPLGLIYLIYQERKHRKQLITRKFHDTSSVADITQTLIQEKSQDTTQFHVQRKSPHRTGKKAHKEQLLAQLRGESNLSSQDVYWPLNDDHVEEFKSNNDSSNREIFAAHHPVSASENEEITSEGAELFLRDRYGKKS